MKQVLRAIFVALGLSLLVACATPARTATPTPLPAPTATPLLAPSPTPLSVADANNPQDSPDYVVTVKQDRPPRWVYSLRYPGNFVYTAPNVLPKTDFTRVILHATHDISQVSVQVLSATRGLSPSGKPVPTSTTAAITHCSPTDIEIDSPDASNGWDELVIAVSGDFPDSVVYFGFAKACDSYSSNGSTNLGWAGPVAGP